MKFLDFYIDGFGIFHDLEVQGLSPRLNLFIGDNEAGKSTLLAFFRAVLFGFESRSSKNNIYPPLCGGSHGGHIRLKLEDGREYTVKRSPGGAQGIAATIQIGGGEQSEQALSGILKGVTKDLYKNIFAFSLDELQELKSLESEDVSSCIYSFGASAGRTSAIDVENLLDKRMKELFAPRGEVKEINKLLQSLNQTSKLIETIEKRSESYNENRKRLQEIEIQLGSLDAEIAVKRRAAEELKMLRQARPVLAEIEQVEKEAEAVLDSPPFSKTTSLEDIARHENAIKLARESLYSNSIPDTASAEGINLPWERINREIAVRRAFRFIWMSALIGVAMVMAGLSITSGVLLAVGSLISAISFAAIGVMYKASQKRVRNLLEELAAVENQCASARNMITKLEGLKSKLTAIIGEYGLGDIAKKLAAADETKLAADAEQAERELLEIDQSSRHMYEELGRLKQEVENAERSDELARELQNKESLITELDKKAEEWAVMAIACGLLKRAREKYEKEKQPRVITEASAFVKTITCGAYSGINSPIGKKLVQLELPNGTRKNINELSRGTREQLYLALRFGLIREYGANAEPMPVIMDDILVNFDPKRADAAAQAISELAESNQILFFTCHPETIAKLRNTDPSAQCYTIANRSISA